MKRHNLFPFFHIFFYGQVLSPKCYSLQPFTLKLREAFCIYGLYLDFLAQETLPNY